MILGTVGGLIVGATTIALVWNRRPVQTPTAGAVARMVIALPPGDRLGVALDRSRLAISHDGNRVAYIASRAGTEQLFLRAMNNLEAVPLAGTENAYSPFFSPDGQWLAFFAEDKLKKVSVAVGCRRSFATRAWRPAATGDRMMPLCSAKVFRQASGEFQPEAGRHDPSPRQTRRRTTVMLRLSFFPGERHYCSHEPSQAAARSLCSLWRRVNGRSW